MVNRVCTVQWFDFIDNDSNGRVSSQELQRALSRGGLHFSLQTVARMIGYALQHTHEIDILLEIQLSVGYCRGEMHAGSLILSACSGDTVWQAV